MKHENVLVDTNVFISLWYGEQTDLFRWLPAIFHMTDSVRAEITWAEQEAMLKGLEEDGHIRATRVEGLEHLRTYSTLRGTIDPGEASALAFAQDNDWLFVCEEMNEPFNECVRKTVTPQRVVTCTQLFLEAIAEGVLTAEEADRVRSVMADKKRHLSGRPRKFVELFPGGRHPRLSGQAPTPDAVADPAERVLAPV